MDRAGDQDLKQAGSKDAIQTSPKGDAERTTRLCAAMKGAGLHAMACSSPSEVLLLTGYWPISAASVAVLTAEGALHALVPTDEEELAAGSSDAILTTYQPDLLTKLTGPVEQLQAPLARLMERLGLGLGGQGLGRPGLGRATIGLRYRLGLQPASYPVMMDFRQSLQDLLREMAPEAKFVSCDDLLEAQKAVKTPHELQRMRMGAKVAAAGFAAAEKAIRPGLREAEVAAAIQAAFDAAPEAEALGRSYGTFFCMSGPNSATAAAAYARTRQRRIETGDLVMIHANTCADGFWTDLSRTYTAGGERVERHERMRAAIVAARAAALGAIRPGVPAREVDRATRSAMRAHGFDDEIFKHATGHGVGYAATYSGALPRIHPQSQDVLEVGMTFNVEPAAYYPGYGGMRHCDMVAVGADGAEVLTTF